MRKKNKGLEVNELNEKTKSNMVIRTISGLIVAAIFFPLSFLGGWYFFSVMCVVLIFAIYEMVKSINVGKINVAVFIFIYIVTISLTFWGFARQNLIFYHANNMFASDVLSYGFSNGALPLYLSPIALVVAIGIMFGVALASEKVHVQYISYYFMMMVLLAISFQSIFYLRYLPMSQEFSSASCYGTGLYDYCLSFMLMFYMLIGSVGNDLGAYFIGVLFGKHKMNERISPKKTWEGFAGGVIFSAGLSIGVALILDATGHPILPGYLDMNHWYWILLCSIVMPLVATLGDLSFSAIKRHFNFKDFGNLIPGHGGVLDRLDSISFCAIGLSIFLILIRSGWNFLA